MLQLNLYVIHQAALVMSASLVFVFCFHLCASCTFYCLDVVSATQECNQLPNFTFLFSFVFLFFLFTRCSFYCLTKNFFLSEISDPALLYHSTSHTHSNTLFFLLWLVNCPSSLICGRGATSCFWNASTVRSIWTCLLSFHSFTAHHPLSR